MVWRVLWVLGSLCWVQEEYRGLAPTRMNPSFWSFRVPLSLVQLAQDPLGFFGADVLFHSPMILRSWVASGPVEWRDLWVPQVPPGSVMFIYLPCNHSHQHGFIGYFTIIVQSNVLFTLFVKLFHIFFIRSFLNAY